MNFKVGDRVIEEGSLELLFNDFHKKRVRDGIVRRVVEANERHFTLQGPTEPSRYDSAIKQGLAAGINNYMIYMQGNGKNLATFDAVLNLETEQTLIEARIREIGEAKIAKARKKIENEIKRQEAILARTEKTYQEDLIENLNILK